MKGINKINDFYKQLSVIQNYRIFASALVELSMLPENLTKSQYKKKYKKLMKSVHELLNKTRSNNEEFREQETEEIRVVETAKRVKIRIKLPQKILQVA